MKEPFTDAPVRFGRTFIATIAAMICCGGLVRAQKMEPPASAGVAAVPNMRLNNTQLAARFLDQATAGATPGGIASLAAALSARPGTAFFDWLNQQYARPVLPGDLSLTVLRSAFANNSLETSYRTHAPDAAAIRASLMISDDNNVLRRQVAYALSQIFVISDQDDTQLAGASEGLCDWYDMLYRDAFTDFATILKDVTYHPVMSDFLSSAKNAKAGFYNASSRPDENYAREVMQLFTIGLVQLNLDGTIVKDALGHAIPTYSQPEITQVARVFTGLMYPPGMGMTRARGTDNPNKLVPKKGTVLYGRDVIDEKRHDTVEKTFLGVTLPAGQDAAKDIDGTLAILFNHPNAAPFFARGLIQRLVTSNPSPAYVRRVAQEFRTSKGDMKRVINAILLDDEARNPAYASREDYGKLREPWLRLTQLSRGFHAQPAATQPFYPVYGRGILPQLGQFPLSAPSVFNFYLPDYQSPGLVSERNAKATETSTLVADPEFQIVNSNTALLTPNFLMDLINYEPGKSRPNKRLWPLDLTPQITLAKDPAALVDNVGTLLTGGMMSERTRSIIKEAVNQLAPADDPVILKKRARMAIYLTMISPDYAVQK